MALRSPWPPLLLTLALLASCFMSGSPGNLAVKMGLTQLENISSQSEPPINFITHGVRMGVDGGGHVASYTPNLVSHTTVQDLAQAAQAWDAANPRPAGTPPGFWRNPYREMLDTVQSDAERFAGGDVDRLGNLWDFFSSFWFFQRG